MAVIKLINHIQQAGYQKLNVAAYVRVSEKTTSLSTQIQYFEKLIKGNKDWNFAGVYSDYGISGTSITKREGFQKMLDDCKSGKIDMVLVKSISRFARNTVDCLKATRLLKDIGIPVFFDKENINSMTSDGELMLTLMASFAQEESRSISENIKWAVRKKFQQGEQNGFVNPYGYQWDGEMYRIVPEEGLIVKEIFSRYLDGESAYKIAKDLAERGIRGRRGSLMEQTTVKDILSNISYTGKQLLQKWFIADGNVVKKNNGELAQYMVEDMYEPLVSEVDFLKAGELRQKRGIRPKFKLTRFSGKVKCGNCGCGVSRRTAGMKKKWVCNTRERKGISACDMRPIFEDELDKIVDSFEQITVFGDRLEVLLGNGRIKTIERSYDGSRGNNPFTSKVWCICGNMCERDNFGKNKVWSCAECKGRRLPESELIMACRDILGTSYQGKVVEYIGSIVVDEDKLTFSFKDGETLTWLRR